VRSLCLGEVAGGKFCTQGCPIKKHKQKKVNVGMGFYYFIAGPRNSAFVDTYLDPLEDLATAVE